MGMVLMAVSVAACGSIALPSPHRVAELSRPTDSGAIGHVSNHQPAAPKIAIAVRGGCPSSLGRAGDVRDDFAGRTRTLLPTGDKPVAGLVCFYDPSPTTGSPSNRLDRYVQPTSGQAGQLAHAIARISLAPAEGAFNCGPDVADTYNVIAFAYATAETVDLWYDPSGCPTLDNGSILAFGVSHASFYRGFTRVFDALTGASY
jgi:hypothetical protein